MHFLFNIIVQPVLLGAALSDLSQKSYLSKCIVSHERTNRFYMYLHYMGKLCLHYAKHRTCERSRNTILGSNELPV